MLAAVALGSNLASRFGEREENLRTAVERVCSLGSVVAVSSFFDTEPVGYLDQPRFLNGALLLETELAPIALLRGLLAIEAEMGRRRDLVVAKGPRVIDLDLLLVDGVVVDTPELMLPHPALAERAFVLEPLAEIAPGWVHPVTGRTVVEMLAALHAKQ
ncbi:2-amino-4-hydroxy-6-hydroxymethyldihydropteridine diphosphokinase [Granulicella sp. WH15]|uniref:2-amino-4-hydroxy-6- hydroxymethyldihydropteridine diphosphokinase n=1 Tax=Granulicella sp. WH15 TaxID=2602070 RepID=UPI001366F63F|nr:2-amino-4-hydroxy-6-hydroxymethyldihydropteridine diphosphokinase [Granulicella sp. WH15]QHN05213.1 2-amino-4-hydroxy-6-hydroxymethyldihydropteridine diphosphokinase [Granulicella sp. WH15]